MMALSNKMLEEQPSEVELMLPWHAVGRLNARDTRLVEEALERDPALARQYAVIREEYAETIAVNKSLGAPSGLAMQRLFAAIDAEPERRAPATAGLRTRISGFFFRLSPRTLGWSAALAAIVLVAQAAVIGTMLVKNQSATYQTASLSMNEPVTRALGGAAPHALVRFVPDARVADITALLDKYQASIVGSARGEMFRLQFGDQAMSKEDLTGLINRLSSEKIVKLAVPAS
jgi:hypothetical protein